MEQRVRLVGEGYTDGERSMSWFKRRREAIPNPRSKRYNPFESWERDVLHMLQFLCFGLALLILLEVSNAPV